MNLLCALLRGMFLSIYFLALFKSKILLADVSSLVNLPEVTVSELNFSMKAPAGWKVRQHYRGQTLVFEDPLVSSSKGHEYVRTITAAVQSEVRPIDALEVKRLSDKLTKEFGSNVTDFAIIESRIIDYRNRGDAILVFTAFAQKGIPMRQMHIFTSGPKTPYS